MRRSFLVSFAMFLAVAGLSLTACGDDDSSFAPRDEDSSSSVCEDCDETTSSSSVIPASSGDLQSSSSKKETSSSSSKEIASSSSTPRNDNSSSSVKFSSSEEKDKSSSSKIQSSSSERSSSSNIASSSSSVKSSSSSVKSSSSVVSSSSKDVASSSSEYVPFDHTVTLGAMRDEYKTFVDERNGRSYYYITIRGKNSKKEVDSVTVMAENLNVGKMITYVKDQADDTTIERYCYDRDTTNCDRYGGLYQWAEMMQLPNDCNTKSCADLIQPNHQGICPDGWRLLTQEDFYIVLHADGNTHGIAGVRSSYGFNGFNSTGYSLVGAGYVWDRRLQGLKSSTAWFYPEEGREGYVEGYALAMGANNTETEASEVFSQLKTNGFSVRCVKLEE
ncbi:MULTISPECIES: FISUMP domain-containing protein [unclassified Fibrobacter]|uniref:FISUMP domain-containing protein n=1 Tax=unclassified Fibrobacter TaxID=2634177 RepID=UPI0025BC1C8A|nr:MULTISPECIES: FISUMP domain-containing protein [unclassified Fibrobacter]